MSHAARRALVSTLIRHEVEFILIGGMAVIAHGHIRATKDVDVVYDTALDNCERLAAALDDLGAEIVAADTLPPGGEIAAGWLAQGGQFVFATENGYLDALSRTSVGGYEDLRARSFDATLRDGTVARVVDYETLVEAKTLAGREKDRLDLDALRAIREEGT